MTVQVTNMHYAQNPLPKPNEGATSWCVACGTVSDNALSVQPHGSSSSMWGKLIGPAASRQRYNEDKRCGERPRRTIQKAKESNARTTGSVRRRRVADTADGSDACATAACATNAHAQHTKTKIIEKYRNITNDSDGIGIGGRHTHVWTQVDWPRRAGTRLSTAVVAPVGGGEAFCADTAREETKMI